MTVDIPPAMPKFISSPERQCGDCNVWWSGTGPCWCCGQEPARKVDA